jgi:hypothetical protein
MKIYRVASTGTAHLTDAVDPVCGARVGAGSVTWGDVTCKRCLKWVESRKASTAPAEVAEVPVIEAAPEVRVAFTVANTGERHEGTVIGSITGEFGRVALRVRDDRGTVWSPWEADTFPITPKASTDGAGATVRDGAQDALDAEQQRTGVHADCGLLVIDHCGYCDVCPTPSEGCECHTDPDPELVTVTIESAPVQVCPCGMMPGARFHKRHCPAGPGDATRVDFIPATERRALASILPVRIPVTPYMAPRDAVRLCRGHALDYYRDEADRAVARSVRRGESSPGAMAWEHQKRRYACRVANGATSGDYAAAEWAMAYAGTLDRGYPKHKPSKHGRNRKNR